MPPHVVLDASGKWHCFYAHAADGSHGTALCFVSLKPGPCLQRSSMQLLKQPALLPRHDLHPSHPGDLSPDPQGTPTAPGMRGDGLPPCSGEGWGSALSLELCLQLRTRPAPLSALPAWGSGTQSDRAGGSHSPEQQPALFGGSSSLLALRSCDKVTVPR